MNKDNLNIIIKAIKDIDISLDAYEYAGYTFDEYNECIKKKESGNRSLRNIIKYNSGGSHIWKPWMQQCLDDCKNLTNQLYMIYNGKQTYIDKEKINKLVKRIKETRDSFKKDTDNCSLYPIQSESICDNLNLLIKMYNNI